MTFTAYSDAKILADSISVDGQVRLTTMEITLHRFVLAEFNTHRVFSRNSASSRAIPVEKMLERYVNHPALPVDLPSEQPGMQGGSELTGYHRNEAVWLLEDIHRDTAEKIRFYLDTHPDKSTRLHKSVLNRMLEPFMWHTIIVTSTEWDNFFKQRCTPQAQPEIRVTAELMRAALEASTPQELDTAQWHLPLLTEQDGTLDIMTQLKVSVARCARVSYLTHDGIRSIEADLELYDETLAKWGHWSPLEHVATPLVYPKGLHTGNLGYPWVQLRALVERWGDGTLDAVEEVNENGFFPAFVPSPLD